MLKALAVVAIISGIILYRNSRPSDPVVVPQVTKDTPTETTTGSASTSSSRRGGGGRSSGGSSSGGGTKISTVTPSDFQRHNTLESCWVLIDGQVMDITNFIIEFRSQADAIAQFCGTFGFEAGFLDENQQFVESITTSSTNMGIIK